MSRLVDDVVVAVGSRRAHFGVALSPVVALAFWISSSWTIPLPLNEVGAGAGGSCVLAFLVTILWAIVLRHDVLPLDARWTAAAARLRLVVVAVCVASTVLPAAAGAAGGSGWSAATLVAAQCLSLLGIALLAMSVLPPAAGWFAPLLALLVTLVVGVDRLELAPRAWAWLLPRTGDPGIRELGPAVVLILVGTLAYVARRPEDSTADDASLA